MSKTDTGQEAVKAEPESSGAAQDNGQPPKPASAKKVGMALQCSTAPPNMQLLRLALSICLQRFLPKKPAARVKADPAAPPVPAPASTNATPQVTLCAGVSQ